MVYIEEVGNTLEELGRMLRELRLAKGETQELFASRIGVSRPTLKAIELGKPTVQVGHWMMAWWALNRLGDMREAFQDVVPLFDRVGEGQRKRARPKKITR